MTEPELLHSLSQLFHRATSGGSPHEWFESVDAATLALFLRRAPREIRALLQRALGVDHALGFIGDLERRVDLGLDAIDAATARAPDPSLPEVILVPGFMGVHLADATVGRVWLDPAAALRGDLAARAALDANGTADRYPGERLLPDGLVRLIYADLIQSLRADGHAVHPFPFDFRRSILESTHLLGDFLADLFARQPTSRFVVVGHSMGALLTCLVPDYLPSFIERVEQTIFLGGPLRGSFDAVESVTGTHWILSRLVELSPIETSLDFQASLATWPGVFGMLPDPEAFPGCGCEGAFDAASWPDDIAVSQPMLDEARIVKAKVRDSALFRLEKPVIQLLATGYPTVASLAHTPSGALRAGPRICQGDGVVAAYSALVPGVIGYRTRYPHTLGPIEPAAIVAIGELIRTGTCGLPPIQAADVAADLTISVAPDLNIAAGLLDVGATSMKEGLLTFAAVAWLLSPVV